MMIKYPKTPRLSKVRGTSEMASWNSYNVVVEEKVDGANAAIQFENGKLVLQSRGHVLTGGAREALFARMPPWVYERHDGLWEALGDRYMAFGEWVYAKNRIFYDALPDIFIEFDVWDKQEELFLSTTRRQELLLNAPLTSVEILWEGRFARAPNFRSFIGPSRYKTGRWKEAYRIAMRGGLDKHYANHETDDSIDMEGVYVKIEDSHRVVGRMKVLRHAFEKVRTEDQKWGRRPLFPNRLRTPGRAAGASGPGTPPE